MPKAIPMQIGGIPVYFFELGGIERNRAESGGNGGCGSLALNNNYSSTDTAESSTAVQQYSSTAVQQYSTSRTAGQQVSHDTRRAVVGG